MTSANGAQQGYESQQMQQSTSGNRGNSPPDRKRMRRNSGNAAPSPFPGTTATPQQQMQYTPQGTPLQQNQQMPMQSQNDQQVSLKWSVSAVTLTSGASRVRKANAQGPSNEIDAAQSERCCSASWIRASYAEHVVP